MSLDFRTRVAIVTGAGAGIGRAHALELSARGAAVVVNDIDAERATAVVGEIQARGQQAAASFADITTPEGGASLTALALDRFGTVDVVINNAGILRNGYFDEITPSALRAVIALHVEAPFFVTQPAWTLMKERGYGRVILTGSSSGMYGHQGLSNYAAGKGAMLGLCKSLAYEGQEYGIKVNALMPVANTTIGVGHPIPDFAAHQARYVPPGFTLEMRETWASPTSAAKMAALLASSECPVNGQLISVSFSRYSGVYIGSTAGWLDPDPASSSAEDVLAHWSEITDREGALEFQNHYEETAYSMQRILDENKPGSVP